MLGAPQVQAGIANLSILLSLSHLLQEAWGKLNAPCVTMDEGVGTYSERAGTGPLFGVETQPFHSQTIGLISEVSWEGKEKTARSHSAWPPSIPQFSARGFVKGQRQSANMNEQQTEGKPAAGVSKTRAVRRGRPQSRKNPSKGSSLIKQVRAVIKAREAVARYNRRFPTAIKEEVEWLEKLVRGKRGNTSSDDIDAELMDWIPDTGFPVAVTLVFQNGWFIPA